MISIRFVSWSLKLRDWLENIQRVPRIIVGVQTGTQTAAGKFSGGFQRVFRIEVVEHGRRGRASPPDQRAAPLKWPSRLRQLLARHAPTRSSFRLEVASSSRYRPAAQQSTATAASLENGLQPQGKVIRLSGVGDDRNAGRQFRFAAAA